MAELAIIFTSDFHSRLTTGVAERLRAVKQEHNALLFDGGDAVSAANVTVRPGREPVIELMNQAGYDAMVIGNREYFASRAGMAHKLAGVRFELLGANMVFKGAPLCRASAVFVRDGFRVGVIGLAREMISPKGRLSRLAGVGFREWREAAAEEMARLRGETDAVVALSHMGRERNEQLALMEGGPDLILAGHQHPPRMVCVSSGGVTSVYAPPYARLAALVVLRGEARPYAITAEAVELR